MPATLVKLCIDANDPPALVRFWSGLLGWRVEHRRTLVPPDRGGIPIRFIPTTDPKTAQNRLHLDLTSASAEEQQATVARALELGGAHADVGQGPDEPHVVLADPEGNEFCVIEPGNGFLAGTGPVGALACDGSRAVGHFWSAALDWPLVWDQDEETAIQSPEGGTKISWGGPPVSPKTGKNRLHLDLTPAGGATLDDEVARLLSLGATRADIGQGDVAWAVLADPDGNEFCVLPAQ